MVENIKSMKTTGLERMDKFMSRFIDLEHPGRNENKRVNYYDIKKRKGCIISNLKNKTTCTIPLDESKSLGEILSRSVEDKKYTHLQSQFWSSYYPFFGGCC